MTEHGIITERNATALTLALENDKEHSVRAQLRSKPDDRGITEAVIKLLDTEPAYEGVFIALRRYLRKNRE